MLVRALNGVAWLTVLFLMGPLVVIAGGSFTEAPFVNFPPTGFTLRWYGQLLGREDFLRSLLESLWIATGATAASLAIGIGTALGLHRTRFAGREVLRAFAISPLVLPTIVTGVALLQFYYAVSLDAPFIGLIIGHTVITVPYVVRTVGAGLLGLDASIEQAAESLGAGPLRVLARVTLPAISPSILASLIFVFITSFDQVTISLFLSGPDVMPLPIRIYTYIDYSVDPMVAAVSTVLILLSFLVVAILQKALGIERVFGLDAR